MHSTNYYDTFIEAADDCPVGEGVAPPQRGEKTVASVHYDVIANNPYRYTSDEVIFEILLPAEREGRPLGGLPARSAALGPSPTSPNASEPVEATAIE